jgi:hypothetical protein
MSAEDHGWEVLAEFEDGVQLVRDPTGLAGMPLAVYDGTHYTWIAEGEIPEFVGTIAAAFDVSVNPSVTNVLNSGPSGTLNEQLLQVAINNDLQVSFGYTKGDGAIIESRHLNPSELREVKGHKIVTGFDPDRDDVRAYRLDRIVGKVAI